MTRLPTFLRASFAATTVGAALVLAGCAYMPKGMGGTTNPSGAAASTTVTQAFRATLSSAAEVPANASTGTGNLEASFDKATGMLRWKLTYSGLSGPATMVHFHGPAMPGSNAGVVVPFPSAASPAEGQATLTPAQVADLVGGRWYVNVHTAQNPAGEIRGQVLAN